MKDPTLAESPDDDRPFPGLAALKDVTPPPSLVPAVMRRIAEPRAGHVLGLAAAPAPAGAAAVAAGGPVRARRRRAGGVRRGAGSRTRAPVASVPPPTGGAVADTRSAEVVLVRFVLAAKGAKKVAVAGDFNAWNAGETVLVDADGQGTFVATVPAAQGRQLRVHVPGRRPVDDRPRRRRGPPRRLRPHQRHPCGSEPPAKARRRPISRYDRGAGAPRSRSRVADPAAVAVAHVDVGRRGAGAACHAGRSTWRGGTTTTCCWPRRRTRPPA